MLNSRYNQKYKKTLLFKLSLRIKTLYLRMNKAASLFFEIVDDKKIISSKQFHKVEKNESCTKLNEKIELPIMVLFDPRKQRFMSKNLQINHLINRNCFKVLFYTIHYMFFTCLSWIHLL